jgi:hypothetical protein
MSDLGPFCSTCGGDRGKREPADSDGLGCLDNIFHSEDEELAPYTQGDYSCDLYYGIEGNSH